MKKKSILASTIAVMLLTMFPFASKAQVSFDIETGVVGTGYNNVRIPGDNGTLFSLKDDLVPEAEIFIRLRVNYTIRSRHTLSLLYAPLNTISYGTVPYDILFEGVNFPANTDLEGTYKFNSYRFTYRYTLIQREKFELGLGFTAKIRDAKITVSGPGLYSEKANIGFVPVINFRMAWNPYTRFGVLLEGDALAASQGRAEDVTIAATCKLSKSLTIRAGYRILEGGADNSEVYNFALFNYGSLGLTIFL